MIRIDKFSGVAPKLSRQLLPDNMARDARNCRLLSGELRGIHALTFVHQFGTTTRTAKRIPNTPEDVWVGFSDTDVDFLKGPLVNDVHNRYYWTGDSTYSYVSYNTLARIIDGDPAYRLGVPVPTAAPVVGSVTGGTEELVETRGYVYTFVNALGEESAPSDPVLYSGTQDGTWNLSGISATPPDMTNRNPVVKRRLYRTVTGQASALFYFVTDIDDMVTTTYADSQSSAVVVQRNVCTTFNADPPPDDLRGLTVHPAGFLAAFRGREVHISEPYRPWAWPVEYILAMEHDIVGLAIYGNMLMVMTTSNPYYLPGSHPSNLSPQQSQSVEPCLAKRSIVATLQGVLYASPNGLVLFNEAGAAVTTSTLISRDEWQQQFTPGTIKAAQRGLQYIAFRSGSSGFEYSPAEPLGALSTIDRFAAVDNVLTDAYSGQVYLVSNNGVYEWDNPNNIPVYYTWRSKEFDLPRPVNLGACIVKMDEFEYEAPDNTLAEEQEVWNASRITRPLNPIGYTPVGGSRWAMTPTLGEPNFNELADYDTGGYDRRRYPVGGSPLFSTGLTASPAGISAVLRVFADRRLIASLAVIPNKTMRLPSGFKAHYWQFELISNVNAYSMAFAETAKGLVRV